MKLRKLQKDLETVENDRKARCHRKSVRKGMNRQEWGNMGMRMSVI